MTSYGISMTSLLEYKISVRLLAAPAPAPQHCKILITVDLTHVSYNYLGMTSYGISMTSLLILLLCCLESRQKIFMIETANRGAAFHRPVTPPWHTTSANPLSADLFNLGSDYSHDSAETDGQDYANDDAGGDYSGESGEKAVHGTDYIVNSDNIQPTKQILTKKV
jgi:hypothetical protein